MGPLLLVLFAAAAMAVAPPSARGLGDFSSGFGLRTPPRFATHQDVFLAADVEGLSARGPAPRSTADQATLRAPQRKGLAGTWDTVCRSALGRRVKRVGSWVAGGARLLWSIPKAVIQGDSRSLIEAIGDLLSGAAAQDKGDTRQVLEIDPDPSGERRPGPLRSGEAPGRD